MIRLLLLTAAALAAAPGEDQPKNAAPFLNESLQYSINWPSGLGLGEASLQSGRAGENWKFSFTLDAAVPGFSLTDSFESLAAGGDFCSLEFTRNLQHGKRSSSEKTTFDAQKGTATRETVKGGKSELSIPSCARDALAFLYYVRRELRQGRLPSPQPVYFGGAYQLRLEFAGTQRLLVSDKPFDADRLSASLKGPASQVNFEIFFARDEARTPVMVRVPVSLGTFSMELVR